MRINAGFLPYAYIYNIRGRRGNILSDRQRPAGRGRVRTRFLHLFLLGAALYLGFVWGSTARQTESPPPVITNELLHQQLQSVRELVTVDYYYTNVGRFENQVDFYGWKVPFTLKRFLVSYEGILKIGVDLSDVQASVNETTHTITVLLPSSKILSHTIPEDSIQVFDETHNIINPITIRDYATFAQEQKAAAEADVVQQGLLTVANEKACTEVEHLLSLLPGSAFYTQSVRIAE